MLNRRKLIQNVLADLRTERSYFDFKQRLDLNSEAGKGKLIRAVAALANTNQDVPSFVIVGIEDGTGRVVGAPDLDDARLQQLIRNYIQPPLNLLYEVVPFPQSGSRTRADVVKLVVA